MFKPMLAKVYHEHAHKLQFPVLVQPKLNGVRMCVHNKQVFSRSGKPLNVPAKVLKDLKQLSTLALDGELYAHGAHLDQIRGNAKRLVNTAQDEGLQLKYHIFDIYNLKLTAAARLAMLATIAETEHIKIVPYHIVKDAANIDVLLEAYLQQGYEGIMIRAFNAPYQQRRTADLLKYKPWRYTTAVITGFIEGKGKYKGMLGALQIISDDPKQQWTCNVGSGFDDLQRQTIWNNRTALLGTKIDLKYLELTSLGNPHGPIFIALK